MAALIVVVIALLVVGLIGGIVWSLRQAASRSRAPAAEPTPGRPRPRVAEFHVRGNEARVYFQVPVGEGEADEVLAELLLHEALEVVREKRHDLPISQVHVVVAYGTRSGEPVEVGRRTLDTPGELPPPGPPPLHLHAARVANDPFEIFAEEMPQHAPQLAETRAREELGPAGGEIRLVRSLDAGLRAQAIDPAAATAGELVIGLLQLSGYSVLPGPKPGSSFCERGGVRTLVVVVDHEPGEYPELSEREINGFVIDFVSSGADRGFLVTDKYAPFAVYERERREPRVRFVSRERLQSFVDAFAVS